MLSKKNASFLQNSPNSDVDGCLVLQHHIVGRLLLEQSVARVRVEVSTVPVVVTAGRRERDQMSPLEFVGRRSDEISSAKVVEQNGTLTWIDDRLRSVSPRLGSDAVSVSDSPEIGRSRGVRFEVEEVVDVEEDVGKRRNAGYVALTVEFFDEQRVV